jgi:hypothetical protein
VVALLFIFLFLGAIIGSEVARDLSVHKCEGHTADDTDRAHELKADTKGDRRISVDFQCCFVI